jgi:hypothetical protein
LGLSQINKHVGANLSRYASRRYARRVVEVVRVLAEIAEVTIAREVKDQANS